VSAASQVTVRDMTLDDVPAVNALEQQLFPVDAWPLQMFLDELAQPETRRYFVAESEEGIVGYAGLMCIEPIADVQTIAVVPGYEGRGIGSTLLTGLIAWRCARTTRGRSACTCASDSSRSTSAPATTATASTP
jgi:ribosomal protein S18 acetylase RimI-like enzyme